MLSETLLTRAIIPVAWLFLLVETERVLVNMFIMRSQSSWQINALIRSAQGYEPCCCNSMVSPLQYYLLSFQWISDETVRIVYCLCESTFNIPDRTQTTVSFLKADTAEASHTGMSSHSPLRGKNCWSKTQKAWKVGNENEMISWLLHNAILMSNDCVHHQCRGSASELSHVNKSLQDPTTEVKTTGRRAHVNSLVRTVALDALNSSSSKLMIFVREMHSVLSSGFFLIAFIILFFLSLLEVFCSRWKESYM